MTETQAQEIVNAMVVVKWGVVLFVFVQIISTIWSMLIAERQLSRANKMFDRAMEEDF